MNKKTIYTIGHSNHPAEYFLELLHAHKINCIVDVRSTAASRFNPQYNKKALSDFLKKHGIAYLHLPEEFGARHNHPALVNAEGKVDFEKVRDTKKFRQGMERLCQGINKGFRIALMCAESEPLDCHRFSMISFALDGAGFNVQHILKDKTLESNAELEARLLRQYEKKFKGRDIFSEEAGRERLNIAYRLKNKEIAYTPKTA
jgi:uncharacterized protein (DUF488 family)